MNSMKVPVIAMMVITSNPWFHFAFPADEAKKL